MPHKNRILIVDDNPQNLKVLGNTLTQQGYHIFLAKNGLQALEIVNKKPFDLILLDIMMPQMTGFEVCQQLKHNTDTKDIPVIFLTAKIEQDDIIDGLEHGAVDYITKPFNQKELILRVHTQIKLKTIEAELKEALRSKDKFFSIIAHDLGNLFSGMVGLLRLLVDKEIDYSQVDTFLPLIKQSSERGYNLLTNLLEWSRVHTGRIKPHPQLLDVNTLVNTNMQLLENQSLQKQITIVSKIKKETVAFVDMQMCDTVMRNLLSNAVKFTPKNGHVEISSVDIDGMLEISIQDSGVGIEPKNIDKILRIDESYNTKGTNNESGTGLGLSLCQEFIDKNNGILGVDSELGNGSRFYIRLPLKRSER